MFNYYSTIQVIIEEITNLWPLVVCASAVVLEYREQLEVDPKVGRRVPPLPARLRCHDHLGHRLQHHRVPLLAVGAAV